MYVHKAYHGYNEVLLVKWAPKKYGVIGATDLIKLEPKLDLIGSLL